MHGELGATVRMYVALTMKFDFRSFFGAGPRLAPPQNGICHDVCRCLHFVFSAYIIFASLSLTLIEKKKQAHHELGERVLHHLTISGNCVKNMVILTPGLGIM